MRLHNIDRTSVFRKESPKLFFFGSPFQHLEQQLSLLETFPNN